MEYAVKMKGINKRFSGVIALHDVDFNLKPQQIHAIVGENGAGKSTLIKILSGAIEKDSGEIFINDLPTEISSPSDAKNQGIQCIYQELSLVPDLSVADNIFLGQEETKNGFVRSKLINQEAQKMMNDLGVKIDVRTKVKNTGIGVQFFTEICRCMIGNAKIVIMDEPTSAMTPNEYEHFLITIKQLRQKDISVIYISHRLNEIFEICDYVTVLRDGKIVQNSAIDDISLNEMVKAMIGKEAGTLLNRGKAKDFANSKVIMKLDNVSTHKLHNVSFELREGEILGVTGLLGAGKTELANVIFGNDIITEGKIYVHGEELNSRHPNDAMLKGIALVPEDRKGQGLFQNFSIKNNISISNLNKLERANIFVDKKKETTFSGDMVKRLEVKCASIAQRVRFLSGGNQQKVVLAKWVAREPKIFLLDEPTRGIDVGSKQEIYKMIKKLAELGMGVLLLTSEMEEVIAHSDRMIVLHDGMIKGILASEKATQKDILLVASGE